ncbi:MAG: hypothetical protein U0414_26765 [Polyangiaceae bacterium]
MEAENAIPLDGLAAGVDYLEAIVVFLLNPAITYASWVRPSAVLSPTAMGRAYAEALAACVHATRRIDPSAPATAARPVSATIEDERHTAILEQLRSFGVAVVFERQAPLGLARAHAHKILRTLEHELPYGEVSAVRAPPPPVAVVTSPSMAPTQSVPVLVAAPAPVPLPPEPLPAATITEPASDVEEHGPETAASRSPDAQRFTVHDHLDEPPVSGANPEKPALVIPVSEPRRISSPPADPGPASPSWASEPPRALPEPPALVPPSPLRARAPEELSDGAAQRGLAPSESAIASTRARALGIVRYVESTSPEPHIAVLRLALRSRLGLDKLRDVETLNSEQLVLLESAAEEMLGLERGEVQRRVNESGLGEGGR